MGEAAKFRVGISGSYGGLNLGDEAILQSIVEQLRVSLPVEITVFSRDVGDTRERHGVERAVPVRDLTRAEVIPELKRLDLLILGGGGILFDAEARIYMREVMLAHELGVPVMTYAISVGPLHDPAAQKVVRSGLTGAAVITVRDRAAGRVLEEIGVHKDIVVTADPAFLLTPERLSRAALKREGVDPARTLVGMSVREPGSAAPDIDEDIYHKLLANVADFMVDRYDADILFVPMEPQQLDMQHCHAVASKMLKASRASVLKGVYSAAQLLGLMQHFSFAVGMRLHFLIFAALQGIPFVALPYASKVSSLLESLELQMPPLNLINEGRLIAHVDQSWDHRRALRTRIRAAVPRLQQLARETNRYAVELLTAERQANRA